MKPESETLCAIVRVCVSCTAVITLGHSPAARIDFLIGK